VFIEEKEVVKKYFSATYQQGRALLSLDNKILEATMHFERTNVTL
jgi:hypothetical protein